MLKLHLATLEGTSSTSVLPASSNNIPSAAHGTGQQPTCTETDNSSAVPIIAIDDEESYITPICDTHDASDANSVYDALVNEMNEKDLSDPVEILRFLQQSLIRGRALDVIDGTSASEGDTNYICVDRQNILATTFAELESVDDFCKTFEVDFMGELAKDLGGPRREWIRLMNFAMREKYFAKGLREFLAHDYYYVGVMIGVTLLQNGQLPTLLPLDIIEKLVITPNEDKCIANIQKGLNKFGLTRIFQRKPILLHLLRPNNISLSAKMLLNILNPVFAPEGSTAHSKEKEIYALFVKYVRQVASGRRAPLNLSSILVFVTGSAEDPVLGFAIQPTITFVCGQTVTQVI